MNPPLPFIQRQHYTVGWICALPLEMAAAVAMLDEHHENLPQSPSDHNAYRLGRIGDHNTVVACLPAGVTGITSAARVAEQMQASFLSIKFGLMVGIGGGVPSEQNDIRLGDVVVSEPGSTSGGVIQYDTGKTVQEGRFNLTGSLNRPPDVLLAAVARLKAEHMIEENKLQKFLLEMEKKHPSMQTKFAHPGVQHDVLFKANYEHIGDRKTCDSCDSSQCIRRSVRYGNHPRIHYGLIASGNGIK